MRGLTIRWSIVIAVLGSLHSAQAVEQQKSRFWWPWRCKTPESFPKSEFYGYYPTCWKPWRLNCPDCATCCPPGYGQQPYDGMIVEGTAAENVPPGATSPETLPPGTTPTRPGEGTFPPVEPLFPNAPPLRMPSDTPGALPGESPNSADERPTDLPPTGDDAFERPSDAAPSGSPITPPAAPSVLPADEPSATHDLLPEASAAEPAESGTSTAPPTALPSSPDGTRARRAHRSDVERTARAPALRAPALRAPANRPAQGNSPEPEASPNPLREASPSPSLEALQQTLDQSQRQAAAPGPPLTVKPYVPPEGADLPPALPSNDPARADLVTVDTTAVDTTGINTAGINTAGINTAAFEATTVASRPPVRSPAAPASPASASAARPVRQVAPPSAYVPAPSTPGIATARSAPGSRTTIAPPVTSRMVAAPPVMAPPVVAPKVARPARTPRKMTAPVVRAAADPLETALAEPALLVRMASAATVQPQPPVAARSGRRPQAPVVECARPVYQTAQAIGTAPAIGTAQAIGTSEATGTVQPVKQTAPAGYHAPISTPVNTPNSSATPASKAPRSLIAPPMTPAPRTSAVKPIGVYLPTGW